MNSLPEPAAFAWLAILLILFGFEGWAVFTHHHTMSQWIQGWALRLPWVTPVGILALTVLIYHLFGTK